MINTRVKPIGKCVAEGKQTAFNVIRVRQGNKKTVYSRQCGEWKENTSNHCKC